MKLGISSYSFTWAIGVKGSEPQKKFNETDLLDMAEKLGVKLVQIADNMPLHAMTVEQLRKLTARAQASGISLEAGANNMTTENLARYIDIAEKIGARILRFSVDGKDFKPTVEDIIAIVRNAAPELEKRGITLAIENHDRLLTSDFRRIMESVSHPAIGICLDCANSLGVGEGFHEVVTALAPHAVNFHLKEVYIRRKYHMMGFDIEGRPFGEGCLPVEWMLQQLPAKCRTAILEQWTPPEAEIGLTIEKEREWAQRSIAYLKPFFAI